MRVRRVFRGLDTSVRFKKSTVVVRMHLGRMEVAFVVVVVECWESFVILHLLLFEVLLFGMRKHVG